MKKLVGLAVFCAVSFNAVAVPVNGFQGNNAVTQSGNLVTFTFDTMTQNSQQRFGNGTDGIFFSDFGIDFTVTQNGGSNVIQDHPVNGGLGVDDRDGAIGNYDDNLGGDETLIFSFGGLVDLMGFTLNGKLLSDGHTDAASGQFKLSSGSGTVTQLDAPAGEWDGFGSNDSFLNGTLANFGIFQGLSSFTFATGGVEGWHGYVESITVRKATVPEPATLGLLGLGLISLVVFRRRQVS